jgi:hemolysin activation/secretion protein
VRIVCFAAALAFVFTGGVLHAQGIGAGTTDQSSANTAPAKDPSTPQAESPRAQADNVVPPVRDRDSAPVRKIAVQGFRVTGVADHAKVGVTPASIQALADAQYRELAAKAGSPVELSFDDMQGVANKIVERYRNAGFIVSNAFLPAQTVGPDRPD